MLGVGFEHFTAIDAAPYLRVRVNKFKLKNIDVLSSETYEIEPCTKDQWKELGDKY